MAGVRKLNREELVALADKMERRETSADEDITLLVNLGYDEQRARFQVAVERGEIVGDCQVGDHKPILAYPEEDIVCDEDDLRD